MANKQKKEFLSFIEQISDKELTLIEEELASFFEEKIKEIDKNNCCLIDKLLEIMLRNYEEEVKSDEKDYA